LPGKSYIREQLADFASILREGGHDSNLLIRKFLGKIDADQRISAGKSRGYSQLRFKLEPDKVLSTVFESSHSSIRALLQEVESTGEGIKCVVDLGSPSKMDQWAPEIARLRREGSKWTEIVNITGLDLNRAFTAWKRYVDSTGGDFTSGAA
jgi:hypothetical protein